MFRTILVPLDGSDLAERALPYARALAMHDEARLVLVQAVPPVEYPFRPADYDREKGMRDAEAYLAGLHPEGASTSRVVTGAYFGHPAEIILQEVAGRHADLIVMSTHGRSGVGRYVYGSVAEEVFHKASIPILIVPGTLDRTWDPSKPGPVLVPLDGSALAQEAIGPATDLAGALGSDLLLVRVIEPADYVYVKGNPDLPADQLVAIDNSVQAGDYLETIAEEIRAKGRTVRTRVHQGNPVAVITSAAYEAGADAVVMATHGRGGLARLLMGSVATGVLRRTGTPILLVRPSAMRV